MAKTAIAFGESGVGKTSLAISLAKFFYKEFGLLTRLISSEGWEPLENESLIKSPTNPSGIIHAFNIAARPRLLADMRKLSKGWWPKVVEEEVPIFDDNKIQVGTKLAKVRRIVEDKEEFNKIGLYFIETMDGISDRFMS